MTLFEGSSHLGLGPFPLGLTLRFVQLFGGFLVIGQHVSAGLSCAGYLQPKKYILALKNTGPENRGLADDQFLQTLLITTAYAAGRIVPSFGMFYDWQGAWAVQPGVTFIRDPFRFTMDYSSIFGSPTGQFGTILDRDNVRFQAGFVF